METEPGILRPEYTKQKRVDIEKRKKTTMRELQGMSPENAAAEEFLEELKLNGTLLDEETRDRQLTPDECRGLVKDVHSILETMQYLEQQLSRSDLNEETVEKLNDELEANRGFALEIEKASEKIYAADMKMAIREDVDTIKSVYLRTKDKSGL